MPKLKKVDTDYIRNLSVDQINQYFQRKDCEHPCEACGHGDWLIDAWEGNIVFLSAPLTFLQQAFMITLPLTCAYCGNIRNFNATRIAKDIKAWEESNGED